MPFIRNYNGAMKILSSIGNGTCNKTCKKIWIRNIKYALKTKTNPLALNKTQRKMITEKIKNVSGKNEVVIPRHQLTLSRIDIDFINANPHPIIESYDLIETSLQFKDNKKAKQFQKIIYKNIYPNIDAVFYADLKTQQVKYMNI